MKILMDNPAFFGDYYYDIRGNEFYPIFREYAVFNSYSILISEYLRLLYDLHNVDFDL